MDESLFKHLCDAHPDAVVALRYQYRMNYEIMSLSNSIIYNGHLRCGSSAVEKAILEDIDVVRWNSVSVLRQQECSECGRHSCWLYQVIDPS